MSQTGFEKLIADATEKRSRDYTKKLRYVEFHSTMADFHEGAALPNELLLKALEALQESKDNLEDYSGDSFVLIMLKESVSKTIAEIRAALEGAGK